MVTLALEVGVAAMLVGLAAVAVEGSVRVVVGLVVLADLVVLAGSVATRASAVTVHGVEVVAVAEVGKVTLTISFNLHY